MYVEVIRFKPTYKLEYWHLTFDINADIGNRAYLYYPQISVRLSSYVYLPVQLNEPFFQVLLSLLHKCSSL